MSPTAIKIGGSILFPGKPDLEMIRAFAKQLEKVETPAIVIGGGRILRDSYLSTLRSQLDNEFLDNIGILVSRINARVVAKFLKNGTYAETLEDAKKAIENSLLPVMGGLKPRQSTDAVAAQLAEAIGAKTLLVLTDVGGIYDKDPKKHPEAKKFRKMTFNQAVTFCKSLASSPGNYPVFDLVAAETIAKNKIKTIIGNGRKQSIANLISGKDCTVIS